MKYRAEIDGLRAVAVIPVILFHAGFSLFRGGFVGVDVFFVISGFLITSIITKDLEAGTFSFRRFYERRARRILPALFAVMLCLVPVAWTVMLSSELKSFSASVVSVCLFVSNFFFWQESGYFDTQAELKPLLHTWSLAVEEQYYLLFPIAAVALWRFGRNRMVLVLAVLALCSLVFGEWLRPQDDAAAFYLLPARTWELMAGAAASFIRIAPRSGRDDALSLAGLACIFAAVLLYSSHIPFPSLYALLPVLGTCAVLVFARPGTLAYRLLSLRPVLGLGLISYSAYLWHQPLFALARMNSLTPPGVGLMLLLTAASLVLAWASWQWIEQPFRTGRLRLASTLPGLAACLLVPWLLLLASGVAGYAGFGFAWRYSEDAVALENSASNSPMRRKCHFSGGDTFTAEQSCVYFGKTPSVAVYGNSHGVELAYGLAGELEKRGQSLIHMTISGCEPGYGRNLQMPHCNEFFGGRLDYLLHAPDVRTVVLAFRAEGNDDAAVSIVNLANFLAGAGKNVVLVLQAPTLPVDISAFIRAALRDGVTSVPARRREEWRQINSPLYHEIGRLDPAVRVVDLADTLCDSTWCYAVRDGRAMYFDDDHMSVAASRNAAVPIAALIQP